VTINLDFLLCIMGKVVNGALDPCMLMSALINSTISHQTWIVVSENMMDLSEADDRL
jgi:hypothetical protein